MRPARRKVALYSPLPCHNLGTYQNKKQYRYKFLFQNRKFSVALKKAIDKRHSKGEKAHVLDIGTGTGLLAMLAVRHGADSVVACEMFAPVAACASKIIEENGFSSKIKLVNKHSTSLTVGPDGDLTFKANILVSEVFDTELIGEGAIQTFNHAHAVLLEVSQFIVFLKSVWLSSAE